MTEQLEDILGTGCPQVLHDFDKEGSDFSKTRRLYQFGEFVGGSDAASVLGINQYCSALTLYMQKTSKEDIPDISDKPAIRWGNLLEPIVLSETSQILDVHIEKPNYMYLHPKHLFMTANFDGITEDGRLVEAKTTDSFPKKVLLEDENCIPPEWYAQIHHYACFRIPEWHSMAGHPFTGFILTAKTHMQKDPIIFEEDIDWDYCREIIRVEKEFCDRLKEGRPPTPDGTESATSSLRNITLKEGEMDVTDEIKTHWVAAKDAAKLKSTSEKSYRFHKNYIHSLMNENGCNKVKGCAYMRTTKRLSEKLLRKALAKHGMENIIEDCREESPPFLILR